MTTTYLAIAPQIVGNPHRYETVYYTDHVQHATREGAWNHGLKVYGSDDFQIAIITDGRLHGIGWGAGIEAKDFDEENIVDIARQLGLKSLIEYMSASDFVAKVLNEGGVVEALEYGLRPTDLDPDDPESLKIREVWTQLCAAWPEFERVRDDADTVINNIVDEYACDE